MWWLWDSENFEFGFKQMMAVLVSTKNGITRNCHATTREQGKWTDLKQTWTDELEKYLNDFNAGVQQHQTQRTFIDETTRRIPSASLVCKHDFINVRSVLHDALCSGNWRDIEKISYFVVVVSFWAENNKIREESAQHF